MCVPGMGVFGLQCKSIILRVPHSDLFGKSPLWAPLESGEPLASRNGFAGNRNSVNKLEPCSLSSIYLSLMSYFSIRLMY